MQASRTDADTLLWTDAACTAGDGAACALLSGWYKYGTHHVEVDAAKAQEYDQRMHGIRDAQRPDPAQELAKTEADCQEGVGSACAVLGRVYLQGGEEAGIKASAAKAADAFRRGCDAKDNASCFELGERYHDGQGVAKDAKLAAAAYEKACDSEGAARWNACIALAEMLGAGGEIPRDLTRATQLRDRVCAGADFGAWCHRDPGGGPPLR